MGNEFKEIMEEVYKFLRDKIVTRIGENLSEAKKEKLYTFEADNQIVINNSNKIIEYDDETDTINISDGFLNTEYVEKIKLKYNFDIEDLKTKIDKGSPNILLEELIYFNQELKIQEKDIIKSLYIQEILKMILLKGIEDIKEKIITEGFIELIAHEIGVINGFVVSTSAKKEAELEIALKLKEEIGKNFETIVLGGKILEALDKVENKRIHKDIDEITDERRIIESTQNLDEVVDSINEVVEEISQVSIVDINGKSIIKFIDENEQVYLFESIDNDKFMEIYHEIKKRKNDNEKITKKELDEVIDKYKQGTPLYKIYNESVELKDSKEELPADKVNVNLEEDTFIKEAIVKIDNNEEETLKEEVVEKEEKTKDIVSEYEYDNIKQKFDNDSNSLSMEELDKMNSYITNKEKTSNKKIKINLKGKTKIIISIVSVLLVVGLGILIGWMLFNMK